MKEYARPSQRAVSSCYPQTGSPQRIPTPVLEAGRLTVTNSPHYTESMAADKYTDGQETGAGVGKLCLGRNWYYLKSLLVFL